MQFFFYTHIPSSWQIVNCSKVLKYSSYGPNFNRWYYKTPNFYVICNNQLPLMLKIIWFSPRSWRNFSCMQPHIYNWTWSKAKKGFCILRVCLQWWITTIYTTHIKKNQIKTTLIFSRHEKILVIHRTANLNTLTTLASPQQLHLHVLETCKC